MDKLLSILTVIVILLFFLIWSFILYQNEKEMRLRGICVVGRLQRVTKNSLYYNYIVRGKKQDSFNGVGISPNKIGQVFPVVYLLENPDEGYIVNYNIDTSKYKYGDIICCDICEEIKSEINFWDM